MIFSIVICDGGDPMAVTRDRADLDGDVKSDRADLDGDVAVTQPWTAPRVSPARPLLPLLLGWPVEMSVQEVRNNRMKNLQQSNSKGSKRQQRSRVKHEESKVKNQ